MDKIDCKGIIQINRTFGGRNILFGSQIVHDTCIRITINQGTIIRDFNQNRYWPKDQILELEMSAAQFAEMITNLNHGTGVPCTIKKFMGKKVENDLKLENEIELIKNEYSIAIDEKINEIMKEIDSISEEKALSPKKIRELKNILNSKLYHIQKEAPFMKERFDETIEKTFVEAKASIDNTINLTLANIGLDTIKNKKLLEEKNE